MLLLADLVPGGRSWMLASFWPSEGVGEVENPGTPISSPLLFQQRSCVAGTSCSFSYNVSSSRLPLARNLCF